MTRRKATQRLGALLLFAVVALSIVVLLPGLSPFRSAGLTGPILPGQTRRAEVAASYDATVEQLVRDFKESDGWQVYDEDYAVGSGIVGAIVFKKIPWIVRTRPLTSGTTSVEVHRAWWPLR